MRSDLGNSKNKNMGEKEKQIASDSLDVIISSIPGLDIAWGLSKALFGAGLKLRQQRALEWVGMVRGNLGIFTKLLLEQEEFQDGFVYALERYLMERNDKKRKYLRNIFLNFARSEDKSDFELEKYNNVLENLVEDDIEVLKYVDVKTPNSYQIFDDQKGLENISNLIHAGILINDPAARYNSSDSPFVYTSNFGRQFIKYLGSWIT